MTTLTPDLAKFHEALVRSLDLQRYGPANVIRDFRALFLREDEALGRRVLFLLPRLGGCDRCDRRGFRRRRRHRRHRRARAERPQDNVGIRLE